MPVCKSCDPIEQYGNLSERKCRKCFENIRGDFSYCDNCADKEDLCFICGKNWLWNKDCICNTNDNQKLVKYCRGCNHYISQDIDCKFCLNKN